MTCSTPGCGRPVKIKKRGLCSACYQQLRATNPGLAKRERAERNAALAKFASESTVETRQAHYESLRARTIATSERLSAIEERNAKASLWYERLKAGDNLSDIARDEAISRERVRQIMVKAGLPTRAMRPINGTKAKLSPRSRSLVRILSILDQFIQVGTKDECWPWTGGYHVANPKYPQYIMPNGIIAFDPLGASKCRLTKPYRVVYLLNKGPIPPGMTVDHICWNPLCCNPDHLQLLTLAENAARKDPAKIEARRKAKAVSA